MQVTIIGAQRITGVSEKTGTPQPYDICRLNVLEPLESQSKANYSRVAHGYQTAEIECAPEVVEKLAGKKFPMQGELIAQNQLRWGRLTSTVVDVK